MTTKEILKFTCDYFQIDITEKTRKRSYVWARAFYYFYARKYAYPAISLERIGDHCGGRDHATVLHGIGIFETLLDSDSEFHHIAEHFHNTFIRLRGDDKPVIFKSEVKKHADVKSLLQRLEYEEKANKCLREVNRQAHAKIRRRNDKVEKLKARIDKLEGLILEQEEKRKIDAKEMRELLSQVKKLTKNAYEWRKKARVRANQLGNQKHYYKNKLKQLEA